MNFMTPSWDLALFEFANGVFRNGLFDWLMPLISSAVFLWLIVLGGLALGARRYGKAQLAGLLILALAVGAADGGTNLVKKATGRVRPLNALAQTHFVEDGQWQQRPADFVQTKVHGNSYPSAHAANAMAAAVLIWLLWPGTRRYVWAMPLLVGWSRLYLGKHYPTDVLMGWLFGIGAALAVWIVLKLVRGGRPLGLPGG
ncbi:phosphatase PAP2 family protein [Desulfovibrio ferrophilus]|uniref:Phosphoesterase PA-phosphatase related n=1 Tax=Desulfovibrio ferrophilus TaxID=241368 RepID=A0A2Z6B0P2_9BACT|nr:phosphatase PAP2 family protein [Desulfovibrio ferrophilus]BBD09079.1 phosphoesterase PA-phosphatase related [Desulfovibrio ferrophilus]